MYKYTYIYIYRQISLSLSIYIYCIHMDSCRIEDMQSQNIYPQYHVDYSLRDRLLPIATFRRTSRIGRIGKAIYWLLKYISTYK